MGYTTDFNGVFDLDKPLTKEHAAYLEQFSGTRRMKRDETITAARPDPIREAVGLPVGKDGGYFVGEGGVAGQGDNFLGKIGAQKTEEQLGIMDFNQPPAGQPGLWCQWIPTTDGRGIEWDGSEKFYNYVEWLRYIINHFLVPWGYRLSGEVTWQGEDSDDIGKIVVAGNIVITQRGRIVYE